jgi:hypothetical protein
MLSTDNVEAAAAIKTFGERAEPAVRDGLHSEDADVKLECIKLLEFVGTRHCIGDLRRLAQFGTPKRVRQPAQQVLGFIQRKDDEAKAAKRKKPDE